MPSTKPRAGKKPERRRKRPVDTADADAIRAPSQQSQRGGAGSGREAARRTSPRMPKAQGAKAHEKSHAAGMLDKGVGKRLAKQAKQRTAGRKSASELDELEPPATRQPYRQGAKQQSRAATAKNRAEGKGPPRRSAAAAEAAPTQKQTLREKAPRKRRLRNEGVDAAQ